MGGRRGGPDGPAARRPGGRAAGAGPGRFWSAGVSPARLRAAAGPPPVPAGLLLRSAEPPDVQVRGPDLAALLEPAYLRFAGEDAPLGLDKQGIAEQGLDKQVPE